MKSINNQINEDTKVLVCQKQQFAKENSANLRLSAIIVVEAPWLN